MSRAQGHVARTMEPRVDHIEITVRDMATAVPFYDRFLPLLGFDLSRRSAVVLEQHDKHVVSYEHPRFSFAITSPRRAFAGEAVHRRKPGAIHHLAFRAPSRAEVDRLHLELKAIGATIVTPPREYPEYTPSGYYAVFFKDSEGIKYEIMCAEDRPTRGAAAGDFDDGGVRPVWSSEDVVAEVRRAAVRDVPALLPLVEQYWGFERMSGFESGRIGTQLERLLSDSRLGVGWIATANGAAVGYLLVVWVFSLEHAGITAEIDEFFIVPPQRGRGLGARLVEVAEAELRQVGCTNISLRLARGNNAARGFYQRLGYTERPGYELLDKALQESRP